jgi:hypothetical protein
VIQEAAAKIASANFKGAAYDEAMSVAFRTFAIRRMVIGTGKAFEK